ncbi:MAG: hypothetical protein WCO82_09490 [Sphingomonadales bacterium]
MSRSRLPPSAAFGPSLAAAPVPRWRRAAGGIVLAVLLLAGSVVINMQVAAEHAMVVQLKRKLVADTARIRELQAETVLRSRTSLIQGWNTKDLHLESPVAWQYLQSPVQLASFAATPAPATGPASGFQLALAQGQGQAPGQPAAAPAPGPQLMKAAWTPAQPEAPAQR